MVDLRRAMHEPGSDREPAVQWDRLDQLLLEALAGPEADWDAGVQRICAEHPDEAPTIRRRFTKLKELGLLQMNAPAGARASFGSFHDLRLLGSGGMGSVYLAEQAPLGRRVALKLMHAEQAALPAARERFLREARILSRLDHVGICPIYEVGEVDGTPYLAMRYLEGETLAARIARARAASAPISDGLDATLHLVEKVARALHVAHEAGLVHRDVKPGNILVGRDDEPVLLDFGLARDASGGQATLTAPEAQLGTPAYMAPEQIAPEGRRLDRRADVYSLGATLYECVTHRPPFSAATREALYREILTASTPDPLRWNPKLPRELKTVLENALAKDRAQRYATAHELAEDLRRVRCREPILARRAGWPLRLRRWTQRNPLAATFLLVLGLGLLATSWLLQQVLAERSAREVDLVHTRALALAAASAQALEGDPELALLLARESLRLEATPQARTQVLSALSRHRARAELRTEKPLHQASFLPDGKRVLAIGANGAAILWDMTNGARRTLDEIGEHRGRLLSCAIAKDGSRLATVGVNGTVLLWDGDGNRIARLDHPDGIRNGRENYSDSRLAVFTPDSQLLLTGCADGVARLWDRQGKPAGKLEGHKRAVLCVDSADVEPGRTLFVTASGDKTARIWGRSGVCLKPLPHDDRVVWAAFSPDGRRVVTASRDHLARIWDLDGNVLRLEGHRAEVHHAEFSPDGSLVVTAGNDHTARLWRSDDGKELLVREHRAPVWGASFAPDGARIVTWSADSTCAVVDLEGHEVARLRGHSHSVASAAFSADGGQILTASHDGAARLWDVEVAGFSALRGHALAVRSGRFSSDGRRALTISRDGTARLWDLERRSSLALAGHRGPLWAATWLPASEEWVTGGDDQQLVFWRADGSQARSIPIGRMIRSLACIGRGERILVGCEQKVCVVDRTSGAVTDLVARPQVTVFRIDVSPHADRFLALSDDDSLLVWDAAGEPGPAIELAWNVEAARFLPEGDRILLGCSDHVARVVDLRGELLATYRGHLAGLTGVAVSPDGAHVLTASRDGTARVFERGGAELAALPFGGTVWGAEFSPDGRWILATTSDRVAWLWPSPTGDLEELANRACGRDFRDGELEQFRDLLPHRR
jgi:WD40 repeat protein/predicted Ser/Thr protein kinase